MNISYNVTEADFIQFNYFHYTNSTAGKRALTQQRFIGPITFLIMGVAFMYVTSLPKWYIAVLMLLASVIWYFYYPVYFKRLIKREVTKMLEEGKNEGLLGKHQLLMTDQGFVEVTPHERTRAKWQSIKKMEEDKEAIYLYNSSVSALILPKRELKEPEVVQQYIESRVY